MFISIDFILPNNLHVAQVGSFGLHQFVWGEWAQMRLFLDFINQFVLRIQLLVLWGLNRVELLLLETARLSRWRLGVASSVFISNTGAFMLNSLRRIQGFMSNIYHFWEVTLAFLAFTCIFGGQVTVVISRFFLCVVSVIVVCRQMVYQVLNLTCLSLTYWGFD